MYFHKILGYVDRPVPEEIERESRQGFLTWLRAALRKKRT